VDLVIAREALIALAHVVEPGDAAAGQLVDARGPAAVVDLVERDATGLRNGEAMHARLQGFDPAKAMDRAESCGARVVTRLDREWPSQLDDLGPQTPLALWVSGAADLRLLALRSLAVVGARACTSYGEEIARSWSADLAAQRWCVLSGAAYGIDAAAHRGALAADGTTVAVLAGGVDVPYPRAHTALLARIADQGLVVSETPPGESVRRQRFLSRNRVIAALGRATLVVEAAVRSGTASTAHAAAAMNRPVLAVPGPVTSASSAGCHRMIRDGDAILVADVSDLLDLLDIGRPGNNALEAAGRSDGRRAVVDGLAARERVVLDALPTRGVLGLDALIRSAGLARRDVMAGVGILGTLGLVVDDAGGWRLSTGSEFSAGAGRAPVA
jgi:DNA processing protein